jgi:hypothetical protein
MSLFRLHVSADALSQRTRCETCEDRVMAKALRGRWEFYEEESWGEEEAREISLSDSHIALFDLPFFLVCWVPRCARSTVPLDGGARET